MDKSETGLKSDKRLLMLEATMKQHQYQRDSLIEILHAAQELYGYLDKDLMLYISRSLHLPQSQVYGVASFYNFFRLRKPAVHVISVCMGTACYVKGAEEILSAVEREFSVTRGETDALNRLSLFVTRCIGACAMAPNVVINGEVTGKATKEAVTNSVRSLLGGDRPEAR